MRFFVVVGFVAAYFVQQVVGADLDDAFRVDRGRDFPDVLATISCLRKRNRCAAFLQPP